MGEAEAEEAEKPEKGAAEGKKLPGWIGLVAVVVSAMAPITTAVHGWISKSEEIELTSRRQAHEIDLASKKQQHEIRLQYLDRAIDQAKELQYRKQVLRFLMATAEEGDPIRKWADTELGLVESDVKRLVDERDAAKKAREAAEKELAEKSTELAELVQAKSTDARRIRFLRDIVQRSNAEAAVNTRKEDYYTARVDPFGYTTTNVVDGIAGRPTAGAPKCKGDTVAGYGDPRGGALAFAADRPIAKTATGTQACKQSLSDGAVHTYTLRNRDITRGGFMGMTPIGAGPKMASWFLGGLAALACECEIE